MGGVAEIPISPCRGWVPILCGGEYVLGWRDELMAALADFRTVSELAGDPITLLEDSVEFMPSPHVPPARLPTGRMAIYGFWRNGEWLKIGKAGPKSHARYASQHYNPDSAKSTLARSLARDATLNSNPGFNPSTPGDWIKSETSRMNILLPSVRRYELLSLLEVFLQVHLKPRYEG